LETSCSEKMRTKKKGECFLLPCSKPPDHPV
jgi:hypothetical protein